MQHGQSGTRLVSEAELAAPAASEAPVQNAFQPADPRRFSLRTRDYLRTRKKAPSAAPIYELVGFDAYATQSKHWHIVRRMRLPALPRCAQTTVGTTLDSLGVPPLLVFNIMMPMYSASIFGRADGSNCNFIYYFRLPHDFSIETFHTPEVRRLWSRLARLAAQDAGPRSRPPVHIRRR